jgi:hypothetical protein
VVQLQTLLSIWLLLEAVVVVAGAQLLVAVEALAVYSPETLV